MPGRQSSNRRLEVTDPAARRWSTSQKQLFALVPVGEIDAAHLEGFTAELRRALGTGHELVVSRDLLATRSASTQVLITAPGAAKREELRQLREQLDLQGRPVAGWVLLDTTLEAPDAA